MNRFRSKQSEIALTFHVLASQRELNIVVISLPVSSCSYTIFNYDLAFTAKFFYKCTYTDVPYLSTDLNPIYQLDGEHFLIKKP
jgi:hypothetical protein